MEERCRFLTVVAVLLLSCAAIPLPAQLLPPPLSIGLAEGLGPYLEMEATSYPVGVPGAELDGLMTADVPRDTGALVLPNVWGDARGRVSGVAEIEIYDKDGLRMSKEVPVKGRSRVVYRVVAKPIIPALRADSEIPFDLSYSGSLAVNLSLNGRGVDQDNRQPYAFSMLTLLRQKYPAAAPQPRGGTLQGDLVGRLTISVPRHHVGRSYVKIHRAQIGGAHMLLVEDQNLVFDPARGIMRANAMVESESLGTIIGGRLNARFTWYRPGARVPGRFVLNGSVAPFRYTRAGYTLMTREEAEMAWLTEQLDRGIVTREISSTPGCLFSNIIVGLPPRLLVPQP